MTPTAPTPVVNNLDLEVISPDGTQTFRGNVFNNGVSVTGGAADALNNVEMVLVNNPAPGDWTIRVFGDRGERRQPGPGLRPDAPRPTGRAAGRRRRPGYTGRPRQVLPTSRSNRRWPTCRTLMIDVADYVDEVSFAQATVVPAFRGPVALDHNKDYYYHPDRNLLIELTEEVVAKLVAARTLTLFDDTRAHDHRHERRNFTGDWATTGPWPYQLPAGLAAPISVSIQSYANPAARFTHGMLHQFRPGRSLRARRRQSFPRPYVDEWDNMARALQQRPSVGVVEGACRLADRAWR